MSEALTTQRSRGMRDLSPDEMERVRAAEAAFAQAARAWGYREIRTPVIEPLHLFTAAGTLSPHTLDGVYSFLDWDGWSGERVVLRPDSTIPAARLYVEQLNGGRTAKLFYRQNVFRFAGDESSREEWQCGVELIGDTGRRGDVEVILLALDAIRAAGVPDPVVSLSHAGLVRAVLAAAGLAPGEQSTANDSQLDGDTSVIGEVEERVPGLNAPLRLLFEVDGAGSAYIANIRSALGASDGPIGAALDELAFVAATLEAAGFAPRIQAVLARSFEYYSGIVVAIDAGGRRVCTGGRYDDLIGLVGGVSVPACGFAIYVSPLLDALGHASADDAAPLVLVESATGAADDLARAIALAAVIRAAGGRAALAEAREPAGARVRLGDGFVLASGNREQRFASERELLAALEQLP